MVLLGRKQELKMLDKRYRSSKFEMVVIYGRRRVGKTALINGFVKDKPVIFCTGIESSAAQNLKSLSQEIMAYRKAPGDAVFSDFKSAIEAAFAIAEEERLVFVIDEYPYLAKAVPEFQSMLQNAIDKHKDSSRLFLILCGSSLSFMEQQVLEYQAPLYGRRIAQLKLKPLDFFAAKEFYPGFSPEDMAIAYGMVGGIPQYLRELDDSVSIEENIQNCFLDSSSFLFEEPMNLLKQETREQATYNSIIAAIAGGASRMSEIAVKAGLTSDACSTYIKNLVSLGLVVKENPIADKSSRRPVYKLTDNMFRFWYRFLPDNISLVMRGMAEIACQRIMPYINEYMGFIFEDICRQYLWKLRRSEDNGLVFTDLGRWWGNDPRRKQQREIDIVGIGDGGSALFAECKWRNEPANTAVLDDLIEDSGLVKCANKEFWLFSKSGFTEGCVSAANHMNNVVLRKYDDIIA